MLQRPAKADALQIAEKQRRTDRCQPAADITDQENEKDHRVRLFAPPFDCAQQGPDQQDRSTGRADHTRQQRTERKQHGIRHRQARWRSRQPNAAADRIKAANRDDERHIVVDQHVQHETTGMYDAERNRHRHQQRNGPCERYEAMVAMPQARRRHRQNRNRQQQADERDRPNGRQRFHPLSVLEQSAGGN